MKLEDGESSAARPDVNHPLERVSPGHAQVDSLSHGDPAVDEPREQGLFVGGGCSKPVTAAESTPRLVEAVATVEIPRSSGIAPTIETPST